MQVPFLLAWILLRGAARIVLWLLVLALYLVPVRLGPRRIPRGRWRVNRRDPESGVVLMGDVIENMRDSAVRFFRRAPDNAMLVRHWGQDSYLTPLGRKNCRSARSGDDDKKEN